MQHNAFDDLNKQREATRQLFAKQWFKIYSVLPREEARRSKYTDIYAKIFFQFFLEHPRLHRVDFFNYQIKDVIVHSIADALKINNSVESLSLRRNKITSFGAKALAFALEYNSTLKKLDLYQNKIGMNGIRMLSEVLIHNSTLTHLNLGRNDFLFGSHYLAQALQTNRSIVVFNCSENIIGNPGARAFASVLALNPVLKVLNLSLNNINDIGAQALAQALYDNQTLEVLNVSFNPIGDNGVKALVDALVVHPTIREFHLFWNKCSIEGLKALLHLVQTNRNILKMGYAHIGYQYYIQTLKQNQL